MPRLVAVQLVCLLAILHNADLEPLRLKKRQAPPDTSHLTDEELVRCFAALAEDGPCDVIPPAALAPTPEPPRCQCVSRWQCLDDSGTGQSANTEDGILSLVNVRFSSCATSFEVCCVNFDLSLQPPTTPPEQPRLQQCGQLKPQGVSSTVLGFEDKQAQFGQFPWMAAVMTTDVAGANGNNVYVSGGSLIEADVVMTAAHYMTDFINRPQSLAVRLGEYDFKLPTEPIIHQDIRVARIAIHPQFVPNQLTYDVALLFLERKAELGPTVGTICLPDPFERFDGEVCYSSGWGKDVFGRQGQYQQILKSIKLPAVDQQSCQDAFRRTRLGPTFNLHQSFMCAGGEPGSDTCTGDGGSPLVCPDHHGDFYVQAGIVSWGIGCGEEGLYGAYASVSEAVLWIGQELQTHNSFDIRVGGASNN